MKKLLAVFIVFTMFCSLGAAEKELFSKAAVKKINGVTATVSNIGIPIKSDVASLKKFVKNSFYKNYKIGKNVEPKLFKAVKIDGVSIYKFVPFYKGIPVDGIYTVLTLKNGKIDRINNGLSEIDVDVSNLITPEEAVKSAMRARNMKRAPKKYLAEKIITRHFGKFVAAYKIRFSPVTLTDNRYHIIDAKSGKILKSGNSTLFADGDAELSDGDAELSDGDSIGTSDEEENSSDEDALELEPPTNKAKIWKFNPKVTPELTEVDLPWVAPHDDPELDETLRGTLIAKKDEKGIRRLKTYNCPDDDTKIEIDTGEFGVNFGNIKIHTCHPMPLANKNENGNFIYEDCDGGHEFSEGGMTPDKIDRCAEVSIYYHASKIYEYIASICEKFKFEDPFYLENNDEEKPLNLIANFTLPDFKDFGAIYSGGDNKLVPMDNAFFSQQNPLLDDLLSDFGISGDILVFGQGLKADFSFDGDVVYHEFGHATIYTAGIDGSEYSDKYGLTVEPGSLHEGMADTFAFLMTDNSCTGEYASEGIMAASDDSGVEYAMDKEGDNYCMRTALNDKRVFEDFIGEVHWDGQPLLASNWDIYQLIKGKDVGETQTYRDNLTKLFLKTLYAVPNSGQLSFKLWAETLMDVVKEDDNFKDKEDEIRKILEKRNFFEEIRARSANEKVDQTHIPAGSTSDNPIGGLAGDDGKILVIEDDKEVSIGPSYLQFYFDVPQDADKNDLKISAEISAESQDLMFGGSSAPIVEIYYRKGSPIEYNFDEAVVKVSKEGKVVASSADSNSSKTWEISNVEKGARYYFQLINKSSAPCLATDLTVVMENVAGESSGDSEEISDEDLLADDLVPDEEVKKSSSSGCSAILF